MKAVDCYFKTISAVNSYFINVHMSSKYSIHLVNVNNTKDTDGHSVLHDQNITSYSNMHLPAPICFCSLGMKFKYLYLYEMFVFISRKRAMSQHSLLQCCKLTLFIIFDVCLIIQAPVAQWLRRWSRKPEIPGSIPWRAQFFTFSLY